MYLFKSIKLFLYPFLSIQKKLEGEVENCDSEIQNIRQTKTQKEEKAKHCQQLVASKKKKIEELSQEISHLKVASDSNRLEELQKQLEQTVSTVVKFITGIDWHGRVLGKEKKAKGTSFLGQVFY